MKKIIIIEDEISLQEEIKDWLLMEGYDTYTAENGKIGVDLITNINPDIIICDIMMPEMDGRAVLDVVRSHDQFKLIPFIFTTALGSRSDQRLGMKSGADDYLIKPFSRKELLDAIECRLAKSEDIFNQTENHVNEFKSNIIKTLPHELLTPLNGILGYGEILMEIEAPLDKFEIQKFGSIIHNSATRLLRLIQNYLLFAEFELGNISENRSTLFSESTYICNSICQTIASKYNRKDDLQLTVNDNVINIPADVLQKIIDELVDNAFKFSKYGTKVFVDLRIDKNSISLSVSDKGRGIEKTNIDKIGIYVQFNRQIYEQQGSGLGLVLVKRLIELYHGTFEIDSIPDSGTIVKVSLPL